MVLRLVARYEPPGWDDPIPECANEHLWGFWRPHPNGVNDVRTCKREGCTFSDWRDTYRFPVVNGFPEGYQPTGLPKSATSE